MKIKWGLCLLALLLVPSTAHATDIYVVNHSSTQAAEIADALPAFQTAVDQDFVPYWNTPATLRFENPPPGSIKITISDNSDQMGAAGYHSMTKAGVPYAKVFTQEGINWQLVFTHELFEMLVDPHVDRTAFNWPGSVFYLIEVGDPVERLFYTRPSATGQPVQISDFVTERWYDNSPGVKDFLHATTKQHQILPGGYAVVNEGGQWYELTQIHGRKAAVMRKWKERPGE